MTTTSIVFLVIALVMAATNWVSVARENALLEYVSKPAATTAFLAVAASFDIVHDASWAWRIAALVFCIAGDVFLMLPKDAFIPGLASFAVGQVLFTISFATGDATISRVIPGIVLASIAAIFLSGRFVAAIKGSGHSELVVPVVAYMVVISSMAVGAIGSGNVYAIAGAVIFMASDSLIAETRFVAPKPWHGVGIMVTYHLALAGLTFSLL